MLSLDELTIGTTYEVCARRARFRRIGPMGRGWTTVPMRADDVHWFRGVLAGVTRDALRFKVSNVFVAIARRRDIEVVQHDTGRASFGEYRPA